MITFTELQFTALIVAVVIASILLYHFLIGSRFKCENVCINKCKNLDDFTASNISAYAEPVNASNLPNPIKDPAKTSLMQPLSHDMLDNITRDLNIFKGQG